MPQNVWMGFGTKLAPTPSAFEMWAEFSLFSEHPVTRDVCRQGRLKLTYTSKPSRLVGDEFEPVSPESF
jgi:hypothetical protein